MRYDIGYGHTVQCRSRSELPICTDQRLSISPRRYEPMYVPDELFQVGQELTKCTYLRHGQAENANRSSREATPYSTVQ